MPNGEDSFKNPQTLTRWVKIFLYLHIVISVVAMISGALEYRLLNDLRYGAYPSTELAVAAAEASDSRQAMVGLVQLVVMIVSGFLILKWLYRANYNSRKLGAEGMKFSPGWSIGWYFIPIANLWKPYQSMKEIWKASANPQAWQAEPAATLLLPWWWFFWIVANMAGNGAARAMMRAEEIDQMVLANVITQFSDFLAIPVSLLLIGIIVRIHGMQMSHAMAQSKEFDRSSEPAQPAVG